MNSLKRRIARLEKRLEAREDDFNTLEDLLWGPGPDIHNFQAWSPMEEAGHVSTATEIPPASADSPGGGTTVTTGAKQKQTGNHQFPKSKNPEQKSS